MESFSDIRKNEVSFCADVKSWLEMLFSQHDDWPFGEAYIEEYGKKTNKRQDLRILDREHRTPILTGEVKMPGSPEGRSPYDPALMQDAFLKAVNIRAKYFFTWNVNTFVLFDQRQWDVPIIERRVKEWDLGLGLTNSGQCTLPEIQAKIRDDFLPRFFAEFAEIVTGKLVDWGMPPDVIFIRSLESHLDWPVLGTRNFLFQKCEEDTAFRYRFYEWLTTELQWSIAPEDPESWRRILDRASRTLCYIFCNRAIFYDAIRARYSEQLNPLKLPNDTDPIKIYKYFRRQFAEAVRATGDYEPIFYPQVEDWVGPLVFESPQARAGWRGLMANLDQYNFQAIPYDIVGGIFQKLIAPEERQKFGQYFTHEDIIDVINAFCIRRAGDYVLDPACGSGSFLVRAYHRKAWLSEHKSGGRRNQDHDKGHQELLREIYGCDIALFPAHLATLNMAARHILDDENYPLIRRGNFFEVIETPDSFCTLPMFGAGEVKFTRPVPLERLDAIIGNPPYVRQELIAKKASIKKSDKESKASHESRLKNTKEHFQNLIASAWPGMKLSGRSDLHCYFWPIAAKQLKEGGYFGFLTSSSWLDVEYGFALQGWILSNFKLLAVIESVDEPWFEDARVKTCVTILQKCSDELARSQNLVKFVRLQKPLAEILGKRDTADEAIRQESAQDLRKLIESTKKLHLDEDLRIIPVLQSDLWKEGVEAGKVLGKGSERSFEEEDEEDGGEGIETLEDISKQNTYVAGKWGRFVRAPDIFFKLMKEYRSKFVKLGEIAEIRFGIKSGCDAFFMPRDVTAIILKEVERGTLWNSIGFMTSCAIQEVKNGKVRIIQAGDRTLHPIESEYLLPEVHSLMSVDRPVIRAADLNRVVLWVDQPLRKISGTYAAKYIRWGAKQTFASKKSKSVPVPQRSTCAARSLWYDLIGTEVGIAFWPMAQQYRHIIPANPEGLVCNHNLFYLNASRLSKLQQKIIQAMLNSTVLALFKTYYGRYAGTEGNLKTEVVDVKLMLVPDVRNVTKEVAQKILTAFKSMKSRSSGHLVEEELMDCHSVERVRILAEKPVKLCKELQQQDRRNLDDAVLEMIGVASPRKRKDILDELYLETARHYRRVRVVEIQKQVQRAGAEQRKFSVSEFAATVWDSLSAEEQGPSLLDWLGKYSRHMAIVHIPEGIATACGANHMFTPNGVQFVKKKKVVAHEEYAGPEQAALVEILSTMGIHGEIEVPANESDCLNCRKEFEHRIQEAHARFSEVAASRTASENLREEMVFLLLHWFIHGKSGRA